MSEKRLHQDTHYLLSYFKTWSPYQVAYLLLFLCTFIQLFAWYGINRYISDSLRLWQVVLICWGVCLIEYAILIPAIQICRVNQLSLAAFNIWAVVFMLGLFYVIDVLVLNHALQPKHVVASGLLCLAVFIAGNGED